MVNKVNRKDEHAINNHVIAGEEGDYLTNPNSIPNR